MGNRISCPKCNRKGRLERCPVYKRSYSRPPTYLDGKQINSMDKGFFIPCKSDCVCGGSEWVPRQSGTYDRDSILCDLCRGKGDLSWV